VAAATSIELASVRPRKPSEAGQLLPHASAPTLYYPALDYLRLILAVVVLAAHSGLFAWEEAGAYAVQVFFALSGWLIGGILLRTRSSELPRFYFNRAARIWIPYFVAIGLLMAASLLKEPITAKWLEIFFYDSTFVYNFFGPSQLAHFGHQMPLNGTGNHFWSICAEEQFYLISPFLITMFRWKGSIRIWFWGVLAAIVLNSSYWSFFGSISLGVLASMLRANFGDLHWRRPVRVGLLIVSVLFFGATYWNLIAYRIGEPISAVSIVLLLAQPGRYSKLGSFLGGISYPLYLDQWIGGFAANAIFIKLGLHRGLVCRLFAFPLALAVASLLYVLVDQNLRRSREQYFSVSRGKAIAVVGFALVTIGLLAGIVVHPWTSL
jgi:peptidoglycan/LPS O-acetylase OafA/YrhL